MQAGQEQAEGHLCQVVTMNVCCLFFGVLYFGPAQSAAPTVSEATGHIGEGM